MEIYPGLQFAMLLGAFLGGICLGGVWELLTALRILFGAYKPPEFMRERYARLLPILHRPVPFARKGVSRRLWRGIVIGVGDLSFCLLLAVFLILLLYRYNDGAFRFSVPVLLLIGFALFRALLSRWISLAEAYLAYGFAAASLYLAALLALPAKAMRYLFTRFVLRPARRACRCIENRRMRQRSAELCAMQLKWAECGFEGECPKAFEKKGRIRHEKKDRGKDNTHAVGDLHPHSGHIRGDSRHRRQSAAGMESASTAGRSARGAKRVV